MTNRVYNEADDIDSKEDPHPGSSLVPMLISGLVLIVVGMLAVAALT